MHAPGGSEPLPKVVYAVVEENLAPARVDDPLAQSFGFNSGAEWDAGEGDGRYLRWIQPMESDLSRQVEYDMDEDDQAWLDSVNDQRNQAKLPVVSYEILEVLLDRLEKEWFDLVQRIPKKDGVMPAEDSTCAICDDGECENSNAIVFCDGCNLAVHQDCYGVPYIPEGQWLCRKCTVSPDKPVSCVLCPNSYGAFKQTTTAQWAHLLCAIWVPDTGVSNTVYMEPIDGVENISRNRWKLICYLCRKRMGACIQCANRNCFVAFHVTCARERGLELRMKGAAVGGELKAYCDKHSANFVGTVASYATDAPVKRSHKRKVPELLLAEAAGRLQALVPKPPKSSKSNRAYKQSYLAGPPIIPAFINKRLLEYVIQIEMADKTSFVALVARYWSLKREARRGAPLLKRLHLEPWTASASSQHQTDSEKARKLELINHLRADLEKLRLLAERVRDREEKKLERVQLLKTVVDEFIFPKDKVMRGVLDRIVLLDQAGTFAQPVSRVQVPDYHEIVKRPMDWTTMGNKLDRHEYHTTTEFQDDVELVLSNARLYNKADTGVYKDADRVGAAAAPILAELESLCREDSLLSRHGSERAALLTEDFVESLFQYSFDAPVLPTSPSPPVSPVPTLIAVDVPAVEPLVPIVEPVVPVVEPVVPVVEPVVAAPAPPPPTLSKSKKRKVQDAGLEERNTPSRARRSADTASATLAAPVTTPILPAPAPAPLRPALATAPILSTPASAPILPAPATAPILPTAPTFPILSMVVEKVPKKRGRKPKVVVPPGQVAVASTSAAASASATTSTIAMASTSVVPALGEVLADEIDNRNSFALFESGWVLPAGSSRRKSSTGALAAILPLTPSLPRPTPRGRSGKLAVDTPSVTGSRKGKEKATVDLVVTPALDHDQVEHLAATDNAPVPIVVEPTSEAVKTPSAAPIPSVKGEPDLSVSITTNKRGPKKRRRGGRHSAQVDQGGQTFAELKKDWEVRMRELAHTVAIPVEVKLEIGELVWARLPGFPAFPAEIANENDAPPELLQQQRPTDRSKILVKFFDPNRSAGWIAPGDLRKLGGNVEVDQLLQSPLACPKVKTIKASAGQAADLGAAFVRAMAAAETHEEVLVPDSNEAPVGAPSATSVAKSHRRVVKK